MSAQERDALAVLRDEMAQAWGGDAAWFTTGTKVAGVVHDWLRERGWRPPGTDTSDTVREALDGHTPGCSGPYQHRPVNGRDCGPIYCVQCSEAAQDWVAWTPEHVTERTP